MQTHPTQLPIPEKIQFSRVSRKDNPNKKQLQAKVESELGTIVIVIDHNSSCRPAEGEKWNVEPTRILHQAPGFWLVAVECVPEPINLAEVFNLDQEKEQRRQRREHKKERPQTGRFVTEEDKKRWGKILSKAPKPKRLHLERHHTAPPPKRGEAVGGLRKHRKKAGKSG